MYYQWYVKSCAQKNTQDSTSVSNADGSVDSSSFDPQSLIQVATVLISR